MHCYVRCLFYLNKRFDAFDKIVRFRVCCRSMSVLLREILSAAVVLPAMDLLAQPVRHVTLHLKVR